MYASVGTDEKKKNKNKNVFVEKSLHCINYKVNS